MEGPFGVLLGVLGGCLGSGFERIIKNDENLQKEPHKEEEGGEGSARPGLGRGCARVGGRSGSGSGSVL